MDGFVHITKAKRTRHEEAIPVYNFHVKDWLSYFVGSIKCYVHKKFKSDKIYLTLKIPDREIRSIYRDKVTEWFDNKIKNQNFQGLATALEYGDCNKISDIITGQLMDTISFYDYKEIGYEVLYTGLCNEQYGGG